MLQISSALYTDRLDKVAEDAVDGICRSNSNALAKILHLGVYWWSVLSASVVSVLLVRVNTCSTCFLFMYIYIAIYVFKDEVHSKINLWLFECDKTHNLVT